MENRSEVAQLRQQIELECEAMQQALTGFAQSASHQFIHQKYANLEIAQHQLATLVGEEEATNIMVSVYCEVMG